MDFGDFLHKHRSECGGYPVTRALRSKVQRQETLEVKVNLDYSSEFQAA